LPGSSWMTLPMLLSENSTAELKYYQTGSDTSNT